MTSKQHSISDTEVNFALVREFINGSEMVRDYGVAQKALDDLEEQLEAAREALIDIAGYGISPNNGYPVVSADVVKKAKAALASSPASSPKKHGRDCGCTPCRAEDWNAIDAGIQAAQSPAKRSVDQPVTGGKEEGLTSTAADLPSPASEPSA